MLEMLSQGGGLGTRKCPWACIWGFAVTVTRPTLMQDRGGVRARVSQGEFSQLLCKSCNVTLEALCGSLTL